MSAIPWRRLPAGALLALAAWAVTGCDSRSEGLPSAAGAEAGPADGDGAMPSIYVVRTVETIEEGANPLLAGYLEALEGCRAGGMPTTALGEDEEARIGVERWEFWRDADRVAYRREGWELDGGNVADGSMCRFALEPRGEHVVYEHDRTLQVDLATGDVQSEAPEPDVLAIVALDGADPDEPRMARERGLEGPASRTVAGQPCEEWRTGDGAATCAWSGGSRWGFDHGPDDMFSRLSGVSTSRIVLSAEPAPQGAGYRLETTAFVIGDASDVPSALPAPAGASQ